MSPRAKVDLSKYSHEDLQEIMDKSVKSMTDDEMRIYKKIKAENWKARKENKPEPWNFETKRKKRKVVDFDNIVIQDDTPRKKIIGKTSAPEKIKIPKWFNFPKKIDKDELTNRQCHVSTMGKCMIGLIKNENDIPYIITSEGKYRIDWNIAYWAVYQAPILKLGDQPIYES